MPPMMHGCAYPGCEKQVPASKLACLMHWFALPPRVSDLLFREFQIGRLDPAGLERRHGHQAVRELSLAHWVLVAELPDGLERHRSHLERAKFQRRRAIDAGEGDPFEGLGLSDVFDDDEALDGASASGGLH